ncbi:BTAD domain-containing putative transcriptional regulator [Benzoatithermus flavus]|uniref:BTAD domain-containing putative transcriptional regulator n=1 Tax=Benzoatithermus flavus TaxID=3108223 RepID=A0ABU8XRT4_9PROT
MELFGGFRLYSAERSVVRVPDRKARCLLAYLALADGPVPRIALAELLCSEGDEQDQRAALRQAVYVARRAAIRRDLIVAVQDRIGLGKASLVSDVGRFQTAIVRGDRESLDEAVELYRGPLLAGERSPSAAFEDWLAGRRSELLERVLQALLTLAARDEAAARPEHALALARRALMLDPLREDAHRQVMRSLAALGQRADALRHYEIGRQLLADELGVEPDGDTKALRDAIACGEEAGAHGANPRPAPAGRTVAPAASAADRHGTGPGGPTVVRTVPRGPTRDRGKAMVARLAGPLAALMVITAGASLWWPGRAPPAPTAVAATRAAPTGQGEAVPLAAPRLSIVVLPFDNLSGDPEQEYFADGLTDDVTIDLSRIDDSFVIARRTAVTYKSRIGSIDVREVGRELGVRYVLDGSVQRAGNRVQLNVQLVDAVTGGTLWAERFEDARDRLPILRDEVTGRIAATLRLELIEAEGRRLEHERRNRPEALDDAMHGWALLDRPYSQENLENARRLFERALTTDPDTVGALTGLAHVLEGRGASPASRERADALLRRALDLEPNRATVHFVLGQVRRSQGRLQEAADAFRTAIALDRNYARAYLKLGTTLLALGHPEQAIPLAEHAIRLSPRDPNIGECFWLIGAAHLLTGRLAEAIAMLEKARSSSPRLWYIHLNLAAAYGLAQRLDEAKRALAEHLRLRPEFRSLAAIEAAMPQFNDPAFAALRKRTFDVGVRRAGMPDS